MKYTYLILFGILSISSVTYGQNKNSGSLDPLSYFEVNPYLESTPILSGGDAADDICIWVTNSIDVPIYVVGTDKKRGLEIYNQKGQRVFDAPFGRINNIDIWDSPKGPVIVGTNRSFNSLDFYKLNTNDNGSLELLNRYETGLSDVYGVSFYLKSQTKPEVFLSDKKGRVKRYLVEMIDDFVSVKPLGDFKFRSTVEGIEGDPYYRRVYIAEEDKGLWYIDFSEEKPRRIKVLKTDKKILVADLEGLALADLGNGKGYLIQSVQGNNSYALINRETLTLHAIFKIKSKDKIDGAEETDGLEVSTHPRFPVLIVQDGFNTGENQNFKWVNWNDILEKSNNTDEVSN
jgi:3-phytase